MAKKNKIAKTLCEHCGKRKYTNDLDAISSAIWSSRVSGKPMRIYPCPRNAKAFHLTSQTRTDRKSMPAPPKPGPPPRLDPKDQGLMVIVALDYLWSDSQNPELSGCCDHCCAPCDLLRRLKAEGKLDKLVQLAEPHHWQNSSWWVNGRVDRLWLATAWACRSRPECTNEDGTPRYGTKDL